MIDSKERVNNVGMFSKLGAGHLVIDDPLVFSRVGLNAFNPRNLFYGNKLGTFLDLSQPYRFQDAAGTTAATADAAPLGLVYDLKNGVPVLGADVLVNGDFESGSTGWTISTTGGNSIAISGGTLNISTTGSDTATIRQDGILTTGKFYEVSIKITGGNGNKLKFANLGSVGEHEFNCNDGTQIFRLIATSTNFIIARVVGSAAVATIDNISVKELPGSHAYQTTTTARPLLASSPKRAVFDKSDDNWNIYFPSTITGTLLQSSKEGIIHAEINKPAGVWPVTVTPDYFPSNNICHLIVRNGIMTDAEVAAAKNWMVAQGAGRDFAGVTSMQYWFRARTDITRIYMNGINLSSCTNMAAVFYACTNLVELVLGGIDVRNVTSCTSAFQGCSALTYLDISSLNFSSLTDCTLMFTGSTNLTTLVVGSAFSSSPCTKFTDAFNSCKLNQASMDGILNSINAANTSNGTLGMIGVTNATPSATGLAAATALRARGWTITNSKGW